MGESTKKFQDFIGKACVQHHIFTKRSRPFLQRNINAVLDVHERLHSLVHTATDESRQELEMLLATERPGSGWDYPTPEMLEQLVLGTANAPALSLNELQIRLLKGGADPTIWRKRRREDTSSEPSWLPLLGQNFTRPCSVEVTVQESEAGREVFKSSQQATIFGFRDESNELFFDVKLIEPFRISLQQLFVAVSHGQLGLGGARWKRTTIKKYRLTVALKCNNSADNAAFLGLLDSAHPSTFAHTNPEESVIKADWSDLPKCPKGGVLLQLDRPSGSNNTPLRYGMEINMGWGKPKGSILEQYGAALEEQTNKDTQQLPTPGASEPEKDRLSTRHTVRYEFDEGLYRRTYVADSLKCLFCGGMNGARSANDYPHISRLYLHYLREHDHFRFELIQDDHLPDGHVARFLITQNDRPDQVDDNNGHYRAEGLGEQHSYNIRQNWVAPRRPFDINAYTAGDDSWTREAHKQGKGKKAINGAKQPRTGASATHSAKLVKRPALEEIQDLPPHTRRRYIVPDIPGVTFYHTSSKYPAERGDYFSEEDDELEEQRLLHSQRRNFAENGLDSTAIAFHEVFNAHMDREQSGPQILIRDGLVRFARKHRDRMNFATSRWRHLFEAKLRLLVSQRVITEETILFCLDNILALVQQPTAEGRIDPIHDQAIGGGDKSSLPAQINGLHPATGDANAEPDASSSASATQSVRKPKTHKWSGGGADRDIIELGALAFHTGGRSSRSSEGLAETTLEIPETPEGPTQPAIATNPPNGIHKGRSPLVTSAGPSINGLAFDKGKGVDRPHSNGVHHPGHSRRKRPCSCGKVAESQSMRGIVSCDNTLCGRDFHVACVKLDRPIIGWRCPDCVASAPFRRPDVPRMVNGTGNVDRNSRPAHLAQPLPSHGGPGRS